MLKLVVYCVIMYFVYKETGPFTAMVVGALVGYIEFSVENLNDVKERLNSVSFKSTSMYSDLKKVMGITNNILNRQLHEISTSKSEKPEETENHITP